MAKAIFLDIDGTLLSFETHSVPCSTSKVLKEAGSLGYKIIIATGRASKNIQEIAEVPYDAVIALNGSECVLRDGTIVSQKQISSADFLKALALSEKFHFPMALELNEGVFVNRLNSTVIDAAKIVEHPVPSIVDLKGYFEKHTCCQFCFYLDADTEKVVMSQLPNLSASRWHPYFADINVKGVNKATGMEDFAAYFDLDLSQSLAFGDGGNDIPMLRRAGIGIAMGNASMAVKSVAKYVTGAVDDNGIEKALRNLNSLR
jgi:Cof subfamily protein (haloacid dehalogenase superfamily)